MAYLNKVMLIGNIGKDPQTAMTNTGKKCVRFSVATSKRYRDANGEQKEQTEWHNIVLWGKSADIFEQLGVKKGTALYIEGELTNRSWTDNQWQKRSMTEVNASSFQILTPRNGSASAQPQGHHGSVFGSKVANDYQQNINAPIEEFDEALPF